MNMIRTAMLLAFMTALFMGVGYLIGGSGGMTIAFLIAAGMNLFSYWNADKMVLRMHHAVEVDERNAPEYYGIVRELAARAGQRRRDGHGQRVAVLHMRQLMRHDAGDLLVGEAFEQPGGGGDRGVLHGRGRAAFVHGPGG